MNKWLTTVPVVMALVTGSVQAAGDAEAGKAKAAACAACHGPDGNSPANPMWPKLAGQHPEYIQKQIGNFKSGARSDPLMSAQAALLATDQDVADVAAYFSSQTQNGGQADPSKVGPGQSLYRGGNLGKGVAACMGCHGPTGMGNPLAKFPRLSGQHAEYVTKALKDFRSGTRTNDPNGMMGGVARNMSDAEIEAVAQYVQGLSQ